MADHKQLLHELLKENQEPFHLKSYIAERRCQLKKPALTTSLQLKKSKPVIMESSTCFAKRSSLCKRACFFSSQSSPEVRKSPFFEFPSPLKSPCKSPNRASVFLHIPSRTAALLVEAAMRIQKQQQSKSKAPIKNAGFGLFGSFMKRLKDRSKNKNKRAIGNNELKVSLKNQPKLEGKMKEHIRISCSCNISRLSSADLEASTSSCRYDCLEEMANGVFNSQEKSFCTSPFRFSLHRSPSYSGSPGSRTPYFSSPAASPDHQVKQEKENYGIKNPTKVEGEEEEEKEQCSPVSVLDPPFEDDGHESGDAEEDDYNLDYSYANVQRAKQQLLQRLRRFEKLAELDPMELERKMLEGSDDENQEINEEESEDDDEPLSLYKESSSAVDTFVTEVFNNSSFQQHSRKMSTDMKRLVSDLIVEEKGKIIFSSNKEVVLGRICNRLDSWKEVELDTIDMMIELDFKKDFDGWKEFPDQVDESAANIELAIFGLLVEEISEEMYCQ